MQVVVNWQQGMRFVGRADSGFPVQMDAAVAVGGNNQGISPMEMIALGLAGCAAMDVISILQKKRQHVTHFDVQLTADRSADHPRVFTRAVLTFVVAGRDVGEEAVLRAMELSATKYCPVYAMLEQAFPIDLRYEIHEEDEWGNRQLAYQGIFQDLFHS